jgi:hypothetical protein
LDKKMPFRSTGFIPALSIENTTSDPSVIAVITGNLVQDPSFEASLGNEAIWAQDSTNFGSPLCTVACAEAGGPAPQPRTGSVWAWFGGANFAVDPNLTNPEVGEVFQDVAFPSCGGATLQFYLWIGAAAGSDTNDNFTVTIDGIEVFSANATQASSYPAFTLVPTNVGSFADGAVHRLRFHSIVSDQLVSFHVDDVSLTGCPAISGNAGVGGATINYTGGSTTANASGNYTFDVPPGWSGTVTPSRTCSLFNPANVTYNSVTTNQTGQNYTASFNPAACAQFTVKIGASPRGPYQAVKNTAVFFTYPSAPLAPLYVDKTAASTTHKFIASLRVLGKNPNNGTPVSFSEMMGLPASLKSSKAFFPAYDSINFSSVLRFANVGTLGTTVTVKIAGVLRGSYPLQPNQVQTVSYANINPFGPVVIESNNGVHIIASLRVRVKSNNGTDSEIMGQPSGQAINYVFPYYNDVNLDTQLRVGNIGASTTTVTVTVAGQPVKILSSNGTISNSLSLARDESKRVWLVDMNNQPVNNGPVRVSSLNGQPIVATLRFLRQQTNTTAFFSEMMGLPASMVVPNFVFPWYNSISLNSQLRVANVGGAPTKVRLYVRGIEKTNCVSDPPKPYPFALPLGASLRVTCPNVSDGPLRVGSEGGVPIIASLRVLFGSSANLISFSETMGFPQFLLSTNYVLPPYDNSRDFQVRVGVP